MSYDFWPSGHPGDDVPCINVANGNAGTIFMMLGVVEERYGIPTQGLEAALDSVQQQCEADYLKPTVEHRGEGGCTIIDCGRTWEQVARYKTRLEAILTYCIENNCELVWG